MENAVSGTKTEQEASNTPALSYDKEMMNNTMGLYNTNRPQDRLDLENQLNEYDQDYD